MEIESFNSIYLQHRDFVSRSLHSLHIRPADLPDISQKVWLIVYRQLHTFRGESGIHTWIHGICRYLASDYRKSAPISREILLGDDIPEVACESGQYASVQLSELQYQMEHIIDKMSPIVRESFIYYRLHGWSSRQIGEYLGVPKDTIRSRLRLAAEIWQRYQRKEKIA